MTLYYWAVRPIHTSDRAATTRIERGLTAAQACRLAFGRGHTVGQEHVFEAKNLGTRVAVLRSDKKRIALLTDPTGWLPVDER